MSNANYYTDAEILPWEYAGSRSPSQEFWTATLVGSDVKRFVSQVNALMSGLVSVFPRTIRWRSEGRLFEGNQLQYKRYRATLATPLPGFADTYLDFPMVNAIPTNSSVLIMPFENHHFEALTDYRRTLLVFLKDLVLVPKDICTVLKPYDKAITEESITSILRRFPEWLLARAYEHDSLFAWQFYANRESIDRVTRIVSTQHVSLVSNRNEAISAYQDPGSMKEP